MKALSNSVYSFLIGLLILITPSCLVKMNTIKSGNVGIKRTFGKIKSKTLKPGLKIYFFGTKLIKVDTRTKEFDIKSSIRLIDGTELTTTTHLFLGLNEEKVHYLINNYNLETKKTVLSYTGGYEDRYYLNERDFSIRSFRKFIDPQIHTAIVELLSKSQSFEEVNFQRETLSDTLQSILQEKLDPAFVVDKTMITNVVSNTDSKISERAILKQELANKELQIELAKKQVLLDSLDAISQKKRNEIIQSTLSEEILQKEKIDSYREAGKNGNMIIVNDSNK